MSRRELFDFEHAISKAAAGGRRDRAVLAGCALLLLGAAWSLTAAASPYSSACIGTHPSSSVIHERVVCGTSQLALRLGRRESVLQPASGAGAVILLTASR